MSGAAPPMLLERVEAASLAWLAGDLPPGSLDVDLPGPAREALGRARPLLEVDPTQFRGGPRVSVPELALAMESLRRSFLLDGPGALRIRGGSLGDLGERARQNAYWLLMSSLGEPMPQNEAGERWVRVADEGQRMSAGGRYHKSNEGGELHTDAPQYEEPPDVIGLHCIHPAAEGGESRLLSAYSIHNALLREARDLLTELYRPFHIHRKPTRLTTSAPIFRWNPGRKELKARYLGDYVRSGHEVAAEPLGPRAAEALGALDELLAQPRFAATLELDRGDILVFDNHRIFHGRCRFTDRESHPPRELCRLWVRRPEDIP